MTTTSNEWWGTIALLVAVQTTGCTTSVLQAGAEDPRAFAMLPLALIGDVVMAAAGDAPSPDASPPDPDPNLLAWDDPDDWVADCDGPTLCHAPNAFTCYGVPGECYCACTTGMASSSGQGATSAPQ